MTGKTYGGYGVHRQRNPGITGSRVQRKSGNISHFELDGRNYVASSTTPLQSGAFKITYSRNQDVNRRMERFCDTKYYHGDAFYSK